MKNCFLQSLITTESTTLYTQVNNITKYYILQMRTKRQLVKEAYIKPSAKVFELAEKSFIMATSPNVRPGGDAGGNIRVIDAKIDDEDTEIEG